MVWNLTIMPRFGGSEDLLVTPQQCPYNVLLGCNWISTEQASRQRGQHQKFPAGGNVLAHCKSYCVPSYFFWDVVIEHDSNSLMSWCYSYILRQLVTTASPLIATRSQSSTSSSNISHARLCPVDRKEPELRSDRYGSWCCSTCRRSSIFVFASDAEAAVCHRKVRHLGTQSNALRTANDPKYPDLVLTDCTIQPSIPKPFWDTCERRDTQIFVRNTHSI